MNPADKAEKIVTEQNAAVEQGLQGMLAGLPKESVSSRAYDTFVHALNKALDALSAGQAPPASMSSGDVTEYPADVAVPISAMKQLFDTVPEGRDYAFSTALLETEDGLLQLAALLMQAAQDRTLIAKTTGPAEPATKPAAEPAPEAPVAKKKPSASDYM